MRPSRRSPPQFFSVPDYSSLTGVIPPAPRWVGFRDDDGDVYYYNAATGATEWAAPAVGVKEVEAA